ncbi:endonuclease V [Fulvivirga ulvae]|uniref:endonuclease V n=1 Tax=Fulvivirga ulvae TaxID=2904245 RepID=UPI001F380071|nr:endonuclease V [Fulvivirga ulvae]UII29708.1 endonuclease V [Fulvivirga ulvae]
MILAFDTYYRGNSAKTVAVAFEDWADHEPVEIYHESIEGIKEYEPGQFYKRELPCILSLLQNIDTKHLETIVVDGYVVLDDVGKPGLGGHLYEKLEQQFPVIGVAKSNFAKLQKNKMEVCRGQSLNPLYITSKGTALSKAAENIRNMHGAYRMPTLLKVLDQETRKE